MGSHGFVISALFALNLSGIDIFSSKTMQLIGNCHLAKSNILDLESFSVLKKK